MVLSGDEEDGEEETLREPVRAKDEEVFGEDLGEESEEVWGN